MKFAQTNFLSLAVSICERALMGPRLVICLETQTYEKNDRFLFSRIMFNRELLIEKVPLDWLNRRGHI